MKHIYEKGQSDTTLLLLHGTGGNEYDLLPIAKHIDPNANLLSVRGNVLEYGMPRFFKRLAMGVFDEESLAEETENLFNFIDEAAVKYQFNRQLVNVIGYSNGANIAANIMLHYHQPFQHVILMHPMVPKRGTESTDLSLVKVLITAGKQDQMVSVQETEELKEMFLQRQAEVSVFYSEHGHQLTKEELESAKKWYEEKR